MYNTQNTSQGVQRIGQIVKGNTHNPVRTLLREHSSLMMPTSQQSLPFLLSNNKEDDLQNFLPFIQPTNRLINSRYWKQIKETAEELDEKLPKKEFSKPQSYPNLPAELLGFKIYAKPTHGNH